MTIESPTELRLLLNNLSSLTDSDRNVMMDTARFLPDGRIASLYIRLMMEKCNAEPKKKGGEKSKRPYLESLRTSVSLPHLAHGVSMPPLAFSDSGIGYAHVALDAASPEPTRRVSGSGRCGDRGISRARRWLDQPGSPASYRGATCTHCPTSAASRDRGANYPGVWRDNCPVRRHTLIWALRAPRPYWCVHQMGAFAPLLRQPLAPLQFAIDRLSQQVAAVLALFQNRIHARQRPGPESRRHLLVVDLLAAHESLF